MLPVKSFNSVCKIVHVGQKQDLAILSEEPRNYLHLESFRVFVIHGLDGIVKKHKIERGPLSRAGCEVDCKSDAIQLTGAEIRRGHHRFCERLCPQFEVVCPRTDSFVSDSYTTTEELIPGPNLLVTLAKDLLLLAHNKCAGLANNILKLFLDDIYLS